MSLMCCIGILAVVDFPAVASMSLLLQEFMSCCMRMSCWLCLSPILLLGYFLVMVSLLLPASQLMLVSLPSVDGISLDDALLSWYRRRCWWWCLGDDSLLLLLASLLILVSLSPAAPDDGVSANTGLPSCCRWLSSGDGVPSSAGVPADACFPVWRTVPAGPYILPIGDVSYVTVFAGVIFCGCPMPIMLLVSLLNLVPGFVMASLILLWSLFSFCMSLVNAWCKLNCRMCVYRTMGLPQCLC